MKKTTITLVSTAIMLGACAKSPSSIAPMSIASSEYDHLGCQAMTMELMEARSNLSDASSSQNMSQAADAAGVFLVLIPPSALIGDSEAEVAQYKGEVKALERAIDRKRCV